MSEDYTFLSMSEINNRLFNNKLLSDIEFRLNGNDQAGNVLYAHTFELAKRSSVLFNEVINNSKTVDEESGRKIITITDYDYDTYYQFIKFLYTDKCEIYYDNIVDLLRLSIDYKIFKLQNKLLDFVVNWRASFNFKLKIFEFIIHANYRVLFNWCTEIISKDLSAVLECEQFLLIDARTLEVILQLDYIDSKCTEHNLFVATMKWINNYCVENGVELSDRRKYFNHLIRLIRYPSMQLHEFYLCIEHEPDLLSGDEIASIFETISLGEKYNIDKWISEKRETFKLNLELTSSCDKKLKFKVTEKRIRLEGIRIGTIGPFTSTTVDIALYDKDNHLIKHFRIEDRYDFDAVVCFGETIILIPNDEYEIRLTYHNPDNKLVLGRSASRTLVNDKKIINCIELSEDNPHILELFLTRL